jgi:hypothetical protein
MIYITKKESLGHLLPGTAARNGLETLRNQKNYPVSGRGISRQLPVDKYLQVQ